jgi:two-component system sensor histidine kinase HydH
MLFPVPKRTVLFQMGQGDRPFLAALSCQNRSMRELPSKLRSVRIKAGLIVFLVVTLAVFTWITPPRAEVLHNILHHLNILPFMLAGMFFGWRGAIKTVVLATVLQVPSIHRHWHRAPLDAQDQLVELSTFGAAGILAGLMADRERMQRRRVETTKVELENVYTELRQNVEHLKKTERLTAAGQLSASLAHEIRNPLASISGAAGILARGQASQESRAECLEILTKESRRLNKLLTSFLVFARPRLPRLHPTELLPLVESVFVLGQHEAHARGVLIDLERPQQPIPELPCDPEQIEQLLLNLVLNALQSTPRGGHVRIRAFIDEMHGVVEIADDGHGIPAEYKDRIFEPFFTTKPDGTGLGLAIAANIVSQHQGALTCRPNGAQGTIFRLELPCSPSPMVERSRETSS